MSEGALEKGTWVVAVVEEWVWGGRTRNVAGWSGGGGEASAEC
jgi:hypothetical protein